jgi:hypothetical protein
MRRRSQIQRLVYGAKKLGGLKRFKRRLACGARKRQIVDEVKVAQKSASFLEGWEPLKNITACEGLPGVFD